MTLRRSLTPLCPFRFALALLLSPSPSPSLSQTLRPEFEAAATIAAARKLPVSAAVVDFSDRMNSELRRRFSIMATPTVLTFRRDRLDAPSVYEGPRTEKGFLQYFQELVAPAVKRASGGSEIAKAVATRDKDKAAFVALPIGSWSGQRAADEIEQVAEALRDGAEKENGRGGRAGGEGSRTQSGRKTEKGEGKRAREKKKTKKTK